ncbi:hypothetical protein Cgig2_027712 [Carnegiea gigantea]|uniref:Thioredoxin domain-containing protein n=1 Tax=Carnegiea gigantea TaxID=171969 RepID=A0A9Q1JWF7_9CARY|nr:hypothetical protein Cgig2_027712 [Carnegiea gigantea]
MLIDKNEHTSTRNLKNYRPHKEVGEHTNGVEQNRSENRSGTSCGGDVSGSSAEVDLPYYTTTITTESSPSAIALARHLHSIGAKIYGAFWCAHCREQKEMFGREAAKLLDYVECFPNGYKKGVVIAPECSVAGVEGFPTWVIKGEVYGGEKDLEELASLSGFDSDDVNLN